MENPTYIALSRLMAQQRTMDVIANNVSNSNTPGFKSQHVLFSDWLLPADRKVTATGERAIDFTQDRATWRDLSTGTLSHTGEPLDLAIGSEGYFTVKTPSGDRLTRAGRFSLQSDGTIGDDDGNSLLDISGAPLKISPGDTGLTVAGDGTVSSQQGQLGKIGIVEPSDPNRLVAEGSHLMRSDASTAPVAQPKIIQGAIEDSNVSPMLELTRMMQLERDFQFVSQFTQSEADRQQTTIDKMTQTPST